MPTTGRLLKGKNNPRHFIIIPVGTGNQFCRNCSHLSATGKCCSIFPIYLKQHPRFGPQRCNECRAAEHRIQEIKEASQKDGEDAAFFKDNCNRERKSSVLKMQV
jgi:hypothetical protein